MRGKLAIPLKAKFKLREPFAAWSHLLGALAGAVGAVFLIRCSDGTCASVAPLLIYSFALVALFLASGLFHGLNCSQETIKKLEKFDYAAIYLLIAGTYTPVCLFVIKGNFGLSLLIGEWTLALIGIWLSLTRGPTHRNIQVAIFLAMGWAFVIMMPTLLRTLHPLAFNLLITGAIFYSVGAIIFALNPSKIFSKRFTAHDLWHVLVLLGSGAHFAFVMQIIS